MSLLKTQYATSVFERFVLNNCLRFAAMIAVVWNSSETIFSLAPHYYILPYTHVSTAPVQTLSVCVTCSLADDNIKLRHSTATYYLFIIIIDTGYWPFISDRRAKASIQESNTSRSLRRLAWNFESKFCTE